MTVFGFTPAVKQQDEGKICGMASALRTSLAGVHHCYSLLHKTWQYPTEEAGKFGSYSGYPEGRRNQGFYSYQSKQEMDLGGATSSLNDIESQVSMIARVTLGTLKI